MDSLFLYIIHTKDNVYIMREDAKENHFIYFALVFKLGIHPPTTSVW